MNALVKKLFLTFILCVLSYTYFYAEGLLGGTLVATPHGLVPVETLQEQDVVIGYDCVDEQYASDTIIAIKKVNAFRVVRINLENDVLEVSPEQQFYDQKSRSWILAEQLIPGQILFAYSLAPAHVVGVESIEKKVEFFRVTTQKFHTFFVSHNHILTHNFPLLLPLVGWFLTNCEFSISIGIAGLIFTQGLTNKEARAKAKEWGYKEEKDAPFKTHGKPAFKKGQTWISPDADGHNGGVWKEMDKHGRRKATLDKDGNKIKD